MIEISDFDFGWLVGWLEGEGSFTARVRTTKEGSRAGSAFFVSASSTDEESCVRAAHITMLGRVGGPRIKVNCKPLWRWEVWRREDVRALCEVLRPHMSSRRQEQIDRVLAVERFSPKHKPLRHGTIHMHNKGCRCSPCVTVMSAYRRSKRAA